MQFWRLIIVYVLSEITNTKYKMGMLINENKYPIIIIIIVVFLYYKELIRILLSSL
jgi:hypothetical protein